MGRHYSLLLDNNSLLGDNMAAEPNVRRVDIFVARNGKALFEQWMKSLHDKQTKRATSKAPKSIGGRFSNDDNHERRSPRGDKRQEL
jgi:hypothetical protein